MHCLGLEKIVCIWPEQAVATATAICRLLHQSEGVRSADGHRRQRKPVIAFYFLLEQAYSLKHSYDASTTFMHLWQIVVECVTKPIHVVTFKALPRFGTLW